MYHVFLLHVILLPSFNYLLFFSTIQQQQLLSVTAFGVQGSGWALPLPKNALRFHPTMN